MTTCTQVKQLHASSSKQRNKRIGNLLGTRFLARSEEFIEIQLEWNYSGEHKHFNSGFIGFNHICKLVLLQFFMLTKIYLMIINYT